MNITAKTNDELTPEELAERNARRAAIREQILNDQRTNAKRDKKTLKAEAKWYREHSK